jgi:nucleoside-diphosphate-sugar epimerase
MSKLISEYELMGMKNSLVIRPFFVIGEGKRKDLLGDWINQILSFDKNSEKVLEVGNLDIIRDFIPVESATEIIMQLGSAEAGVFNLGSGQPVSLREIIDILKYISDIDFEVRENVGTKTRNRDRNYVVANIDQLNRVCELSSEGDLTEHIRKIFTYYGNFYGDSPRN